MAMISVRDLGIRFHQGRRRHLRVREMVFHGFRRMPQHGTFWPLRHVNFDIAPGEAVGIVGRNGTGKSTLLKLIAGVLVPDEGSVRLGGRVAPLLELSSGFAADLTGRENIHLVGSLHGIAPAQMRTRFDRIVEFAGEQVQRSLDSPVRHYSSGMRVRLGFSIIAQLEHPILLVDEVMAVGDAEFRRKCYNTMERLLTQGRTLLLVSHHEDDLTRFCTRGLFLNEGGLAVDGTMNDALGAYKEAVST
jgi:ABC-2 type transport system ATP-binding protein